MVLGSDTYLYPQLDRLLAKFFTFIGDDPPRLALSRHLLQMYLNSKTKGYITYLYLS